MSGAKWAPKVNDKDGGRDHWYQSGFGLVVGGRLKMGQVIGATDARAERVTSRTYITTVTDPTGRPSYLLDDAKQIDEVL